MNTVNAGNESAYGKVLTVSVAAYNVERYLAQALESCVVPSMDKLEVIVVDDGSIDDTVTIAQRYVGRYPEIFRLISKENGGYGSTVNTSLAVASGKYFKLLDGDDWFDSDALERYLSILASTDADMSFTQNIKVTERKGDSASVVARNPLEGDTSGSYAANELHPKGHINMHCAAFRTSLLRSCGLRLMEHCFYTDSEFMAIPMFSVHSVRVDHFPLYQYRIGRAGQSVSAAGIARHLLDHTQLGLRLIENYRVQSALHPDNSFAHCVEKARVLSTCASGYVYRTQAPNSREARIQLQEFDALLRQADAEFWAWTAEYSRQVRLLRRTRFALTPLFALYDKKFFAS